MKHTILLAIAGSSIVAFSQQPKLSDNGKHLVTVNRDLKSIETAIETYEKVGGKYPTEKQGLDALVRKPKDGPRPRRWVQATALPVADPWGSPYRYHFPGKQNPEKPEIISAGPDQKFGTEDDLSNQEPVVTDLKSIETALETHKKVSGNYPTEKQGLDALIRKPEDGPRPKRWVQTMTGPIIDSWGSPYRYHFPGKQNSEKPEIISAGPDQKFGTEDDLSNQD